AAFEIDVDDLRRRVFLFPVGNVELVLETCLDEHAWEQSRFFDALFLICHPSYIRSSYQNMHVAPTDDNVKANIIHDKEGIPSGPAEAHLSRESARGWTDPPLLITTFRRVHSPPCPKSLWW
ncbi:hypothetical protein Tco_1300232, partial [Tanacetum coccineum]